MGHSARGTQCEGDKAQGRRSARETRCEGEIDEAHGRQGMRETRCNGERDKVRGRSLTAYSSHSVISLVLIEYKNVHTHNFAY